MSDKPEVTHVGIFDMQVCVPKDWTDDQVKTFAEREAPCGTEHGWHIRREGSKGADYRERVKCEGRADCVHIMLDA